MKWNAKHSSLSWSVRCFGQLVFFTSTIFIILLLRKAGLLRSRKCRFYTSTLEHDHKSNSVQHQEWVFALLSMPNGLKPFEALGNMQNLTELWSQHHPHAATTTLTQADPSTTPPPATDPLKHRRTNAQAHVLNPDIRPSSLVESLRQRESRQSSFMGGWQTGRGRGSCLDTILSVWLW